MTSVCARDKRGHTQRERRVKTEAEGCSFKPWYTYGHQNLGEAGKGPSLELPEGTNAVM